MKQCPFHAGANEQRFVAAYPKPLKSKASWLLLFLSARRSWLDGLFERSYRMKMGEVRLLRTRLYMLNEPPLVKRVLVEQAKAYPKHVLLGAALRPLLGDSIFTANGAQWERQRRMIAPAFAQTRLNVVFGLMRDAAAAMVERLEALPDKVEHDVELEMSHVTADIILRTILSRPLQGDEARRIFAAFSQFQALAPRLALPALYGVRWLTPFWQVMRSRRCAREIRTILERIIRPRFDAHRAGSSEDHRDILASLLDARDEENGNEPMSFDEVVDEVAMLFLAGHETSASALSWSLYLLGHSPDIQERLHAEVMATTGGTEVTPEHLRDLEFTRQVFREAMRLFPPVGFLARQAAADDSMRDKSVAAGASMVISPWLIHRHRELWDRPDEFDPDRFATDAGRESARGAYLPFGMGPRVCMGAGFAMQEAALLLATLAARYRFAPAPGHVPEPVGRLTIRSANGIRMVIEKRGTASS